MGFQKGLESWKVAGVDGTHGVGEVRVSDPGFFDERDNGLFFDWGKGGAVLSVFKGALALGVGRPGKSAFVLEEFDQGRRAGSGGNVVGGCAVLVLAVGFGALVQ